MVNFASSAHGASDSDISDDDGFGDSWYAACFGHPSEWATSLGTELGGSMCSVIDDSSAILDFSSPRIVARYFCKIRRVHTRKSNYITIIYSTA